MNRKVINFFEPETFEGVKTYWAWKKIDLERTINALDNLLKQNSPFTAEILEAKNYRLAQLRLIESLQTKHKYGEF